MKEVIVQLDGGLGNQLFQYAFARHLAILNNAKLLLDSTTCYSYDSLGTGRAFMLRAFSIDTKCAIQQDLDWANNLRIWQRLKIVPRWIHLRENTFNKFQEDTLKEYKRNLYVVGHWQNENYFKAIAPLLKKEFTVKKEFSDQYANDILKLNSVAIHVRRGDYINTSEYSAQYCDLFAKGYYKNAVEAIKQKMLNSVFFIFSDDIEWCKNNMPFLNNEAYFIEHTEGSVHDFYLMSLCKSQIIANSTFSWWAAWLNSNPDKIVVCPSKWFLNDWNDGHYTLKDWIKI